MMPVVVEDGTLPSDALAWRSDIDGDLGHGPVLSVSSWSAGGVYTVTLTASGADGTATQTKTDLITVYTPVQADFSAEPTSGVAPLSVAFANTSTGDYTSSQWDFGDG